MSFLLKWKDKAHLFFFSKGLDARARPRVLLVITRGARCKHGVEFCDFDHRSLRGIFQISELRDRQTTRTRDSPKEQLEMEKHLYVLCAQPHNWSVVCALVSDRIPPHVHGEYTPIAYTYSCFCRLYQMFKYFVRRSLALEGDKQM